MPLLRPTLLNNPASTLRLGLPLERPHLLLHPRIHHLVPTLDTGRPALALIWSPGNNHLDGLPLGFLIGFGQQLGDAVCLFPLCHALGRRQDVALLLELLQTVRRPELLAGLGFAYLLDGSGVQCSQFLFDGLCSGLGDRFLLFVVPRLVLNEPLWQAIPVSEGVLVEAIVDQVVTGFFARGELVG